MENMPALLISACKGPNRALYASANLTTDSNDRRSSSITFHPHNNNNSRNNKCFKNQNLISTEERNICHLNIQR